MIKAEKPRTPLLGPISFFFATGCGISLLPTAILKPFSSSARGQKLVEKKWTGAGFLGSIEGTVTYLILPEPVRSFWWVIPAGIVVSVIVSGLAESFLHSHDDSRIVIDEWIGALIACWGLKPQLSPLLILSFVLFRVFDVLKGPVGSACQKLPGGWGVTMDDVYAGFAANLVWRFCLLFWH